MDFTDNDITLRQAIRLIGTPYIWGGNDPLNGLDCSGLVLWLKVSSGKWKHGVDANAQGIFTHLRGKGRESAKHWGFGALAFYGPHSADIRHIAFCLNQNLMIEAGGGDSTTRTVADAKIKGACVRVRPVRYRADLVAVLED